MLKSSVNACVLAASMRTARMQGELRLSVLFEMHTLQSSNMHAECAKAM